VHTEDLFNENTCSKLIVGTLKCIGISPVNLELLHDGVEVTGRSNSSLNTADFLMTHLGIESVQVENEDYLLESCSYNALCALPIRLLENLGRNKLISNFSGIDLEEAEEITMELTEAMLSMSKTKTGALIVIERETALTDIIETGTVIKAGIQKEMIENIFYEGAPLHDGALIVRGDKLWAAGCVLPLTEDKKLSKELGTRHRAGIGITENSDALVFIVSEESGIISKAEDGKLQRRLGKQDIEALLNGIYIVPEKDSLLDRVSRILRGGKKNA
jgi:DNA integrity scanning protein DisA with diadenylate cyclase activity